MRNFWIEADSSTRKTTATCGGNDASVDVRAKVDGESVLAVRINCWTDDKGELHISVDDHRKQYNLE